jgi:hypothetical protein
VTTIIGENKIATPYYKRKIRCPGHFLIPPTVDIYLREPVSWIKQLSGRKEIEVKGRKIKIRRDKIQLDRYGRKMVDWKKLYKLRDVGIVEQPWVSAAWCVENIHDPLSSLCRNCAKYCKEGQGRVVTTTINRLNGHYNK